MTPPLHVLIDGTNIAHAAYHATRDSGGIESIVGIMSHRVKAIRAAWKPAEIVAAFDCGDTFRHRLEPTYKAGRVRHEETAAAIEATQNAMIDAAVPIVVVDDFEADDIIATFARRAVVAGSRVVVYSADKDLHQLIEPGHVAHATSIKRDGDKIAPTWATAETIRAKYGVDPSQWVDFRIMVGDKSDNIGGIEGIGPVAAAEVLRAYGSLDAFYADGNKLRADIQPRQRARLINARPQVEKLRQLVTLRFDVPLTVGWIL